MQTSGLTRLLILVPASLWALVLAFGSARAAAGMLGMPAALADFHFDGDRPVYALSLAGSRLELTADNSVRLTAYDEPNAPLTRPLVRLRADRNGRDLLAGPFNLFGALTPAAEEDVPTLLSDSIQAMQTVGTGFGLDFLLSGARVTGERAQQLRNLGIFASVAGIPDEEYWAQADTMGAVLALMQVSELTRPTAPTPVPGPLWLLPAGLLPLLRQRRAGQEHPSCIGGAGPGRRCQPPRDARVPD